MRYDQGLGQATNITVPHPNARAMNQTPRQRMLGFDMQDRDIDGCDMQGCDMQEASAFADDKNHETAATIDSNEGSEVEPVSGLPPLDGPYVPPSNLKGLSVWVVDAHALIYQVFHVMSEMTGPSGQPVGAIHGFTRDMLDILEKKKPDYLIFAFDHSDETFRHEIYGQYKQNRSAMPEDLKPQIPQILRMLDASASFGFRRPDMKRTTCSRPSPAKLTKLKGPAFSSPTTRILIS